LKVKFELGLFDDPYKYCDENRELTTVGKPEFQEVVLDMAKIDCCSLKNDKDLLPLKKQDKK
jgi:beta-glucosidase